MATARAAAAPAARAPAQPRGGFRGLTALLSFVAFVAAWQLLVVATGIQPILLPAPGSVVSELFEVWRIGILWPSVLDSLEALFVGLGAALILGIVLGLLIGASRWLDLIAAPYLWGLFATPRIAMAPLIVLWFGLGYQAKTLLVFLSALLPLMINCKEGVQTVDESLVRAARAFGARRTDLFKKVVVPYTLPFIANGVRNAVARGFVGLLVIEMTVGSGGIGTEVMRSMKQFNTARMFAFIAVLMVVALALITLSRKLEAHVSRWREEIYV